MEQKSLDIQEDVRELQVQLEEHEGEYIPPVNHYFQDGMYCREMFAHAGTLAIGVTHTQPCINLLTEGTCVATEASSKEAIELKAPQIFLSAAGKQKIIYFKTDSIIVNMFRTDETDIDKLESMLFEENFKVLRDEAKQRIIQKKGLL